MNSLTLLRRATVLALVTVLLVGCGGAQVNTQDTQVPDSPTSSPTEPSPVPSATETSPAAPEPDSPSIPDAPLSPTGPWLIFFTGVGVWADGIWAVNPDGSGLTQLTSQNIVIPRDLDSAVTSSPGFLAFITADDYVYRGLALNVLRLPSGELRMVTPLSSAATEPAPDADPAMRPPEPLVAIAGEVSLAWSQDGRSLAFMGAFEGPSSDLYVYVPDSGDITRLTDGPSESIRPSWSPDGRYILHFGVETLGSGAGLSMTEAWAARADDSGVVTLYDASNSADEVVLGWTADDTFVVYTLNRGLGRPGNLRTVMATTGDATTLWEGLLTAAALDPTSGNILISVGPDSDQPPGLHLVSSSGAPAWRIVEDEASRVTWLSEAELFFATTENGILAVSSQGDFIDLAVPPSYSGFPAAAPSSGDLAFTGSGLWVGSLLSSIDSPPRQVYSGRTYQAMWSPDGQHLIFFGDEGVFAAQGPAFEPVLVAEGLISYDAIWVWP